MCFKSHPSTRLPNQLLLAGLKHFIFTLRLGDFTEIIPGYLIRVLLFLSQLPRKRLCGSLNIVLPFYDLGIWGSWCDTNNLSVNMQLNF